jgi:hypothetical protein
MVPAILSFLKNENGAITVDWVVITAAVVGLSAIGFLGFETVSTSLVNAASDAVAAQDDFN